jgi:hypothetical protein
MKEFTDARSPGVRTLCFLLPVAVSATAMLVTVFAAPPPASARVEEPSLKSCVSAALARPKNVGTIFLNPGEKAQQEVSVSADFPPLSAGCQSLIVRQAPSAVFKMQRPRNHERWVRTEAVEFFSEASHQFQTVGAEGGTGVARYRPKAPTNHFRYRCTPGRGVTHVRVVITVKVDSAEDASLLARKPYSWPVKIETGLEPILGRVSGPC